MSRISISVNMLAALIKSQATGVFDLEVISFQANNKINLKYSQTLFFFSYAVLTYFSNLFEMGRTLILPVWRIFLFFFFRVLTTMKVPCPIHLKYLASLGTCCWMCWLLHWQCLSVFRVTKIETNFSLCHPVIPEFQIHKDCSWLQLSMPGSRINIF